MLEPEYFNDKADRMLELYRELEDFILQDISMRLLKSQSMSATADRMIWKLQQMGESRAEIMKKLSKITGLSRKELKALLQDAVLTSWKDDLSTFNQIGINIASPLENPLIMAVMDAEYRKSQGELENLTRTTMNQANKDLIQMLDAAELRVASGVQSYSGAVCDILDNYAGKGVTIEYPTGTKRTLEAAVRMCVTTSMNQTSAEITNRYIVENGIEYVRVSAHLGARVQRPGQPELAGHDNWQGHVFKRHGSEPGYPNLAEATGYDIAENGAGINVNMLGLHGYGCRHSHAAWDKRLRNDYFDKDGNPRIDTEENRKEYERQQKQRAMERVIRKTKRELLVKQSEIKMVAETDVKEMLQQQYDGLSYKFRTQNEKYRQFCTENKMKMQYDRLKVAGFKRQQAAQANGRATAFSNAVVGENAGLQEISVDGTMKVEELEQVHTIIEGQNLIGEYTPSDNYDHMINDIVHQQGFDGKPQIVPYEEFKQKMEDSNFYAERTYSAADKTTLDSYRQELYGEKGDSWYLDCSTGGSQYGQGMYCASSYDLTDNKAMGGIGREMMHYQEVNSTQRGNPLSYTEGLTLDKTAKIFELPKGATRNETHEFVSQKYVEEYAKKFSTALQKDAVTGYIKACDAISKLTFKESDEVINALYNERAVYATEIEDLIIDAHRAMEDITDGKKYHGTKDPGVLVAEMGYDAIKAIGHGESGSYTVILNRTKIIFCEGGSIYDN